MNYLPPSLDPVGRGSRQPLRRRAGTPALSPTQRRRRRADGSTIEVRPPWWLRLSPARVALAGGTALLLSLLLCIHLWPNRVSLRLGDVAGEDIVAQRTIAFEDTAQTAQLREEAADQVVDQYDAVIGATGASRETVSGIYDSIARAAAARAALPRAAMAARAIRQQRRAVISDRSVGVLLRQPAPVRARLENVSLLLIERAMDRSIADRNSDLRDARQRLAGDTAVTGRVADPALRAAVVEIAQAALVSNRSYDPLATEHARQTAQAGVAAQMRRIVAGSAVVRRGERVSQQHLDAFAALGLQNARLDAAAVSTISLMVVLLIALVAVYLRLFHTDLFHDTPQLFLLALLSIISVVGLKVGSTLLGLPFSGVHFGYLGMMCVASAGMAIALLISPHVATLIVALLSVASGLILNNELRFTVITLGSSLVGIVSVATLRNRTELVRAAVFLCVSNAALNVLVGHLEGDTFRELITGMLWGVVSGLFALVLFWIGVAVFEKPFGITTHLRLLELSDPATPILQEFRMRVPGTYAHSLMVGNLAHAAAEAIGADGLLARVAAYYHDLGKMNRPEFFIENQSNAENIHDRLAPSMSALILISHVKDGLEMAAAVGLPPRVCDVIQQHHGTSLMKYFYHRATGGAQDPTLEAQFRYAGPKPQTKEAAILMLADSVEAASRTLDKPTPARIADFVARMVEDKRADGQLDECDLTLRDLKTIQDVFARTLSGTLHARVEYPAPPGAKASPTMRPITVAALPSTFPEEALDGALSVLDGGKGTNGDNGSNRRGGASGARPDAGPERGRESARPRR